MGVSVFPAPSTSTSVPGDSNRAPKFTYNNTYDLSSISGMNVIHGTSTAMTYRRTDGCIYFTSGNTSDIWKFNTATNTGSYVSSSAPWSGPKDIVSAYDGTLYSSYSEPSDVNLATPFYSTDGGVNWNSLTTSTSGTNRGFIGLIDNGEIPGTSGNIVHLHGASSTVGDGASWWEGTTKAASGVASVVSNDQISIYNGGRAVFPLRDGDDVKTGTNAIWVGCAHTTTAFGVSRNGAVYSIRPAHYSVRGAGTTTRALCFNVSPVVLAYAGSTYSEPMFNINKPTTIDSRWIVGVDTTSSGNALHVIDYKTFLKSGTVPLPAASVTLVTYNGNSTANPIYVSATKKLYVLQANSNGVTNVTRMHVYDVTTY